MNIIDKIDNYYKKQHKKLKSIVDLEEQFIIKIDNNSNNLLHLFDYNGNKKFTTQFNFYGIVDKNKNFIWANILSGMNNSIFKDKIEKIKDRGDFNKESINPRYIFYQNLLKNDKVKITSKEQLLWINKLLMFLSNDYYYLNPINSKKNIQLIGIHKIKGKYF